jgi:hypothetical protein
MSKIATNGELIRKVFLKSVFDAATTAAALIIHKARSPPPKLIALKNASFDISTEPAQEPNPRAFAIAVSGRKACILNLIKSTAVKPPIEAMFAGEIVRRQKPVRAIQFLSLNQSIKSTRDATSRISSSSTRVRMATTPSTNEHANQAGPLFQTGHSLRMTSTKIVTMHKHKDVSIPSSSQRTAEGVTRTKRAVAESGQINRSALACFHKALAKTRNNRQ